MNVELETMTTTTYHIDLDREAMRVLRYILKRYHEDIGSRLPDGEPYTEQELMSSLGVKID